MAPVPLTIVTDDYDRVQGVKTGAVPVAGCEVNYFHLPPSSAFPRLMRNHEFQVCEMSLSTYMLSRSRYDLPYRAIPVILSRVFAHMLDLGAERRRRPRRRRTSRAGPWACRTIISPGGWR